MPLGVAWAAAGIESAVEAVVDKDLDVGFWQAWLSALPGHLWNLALRVALAAVLFFLGLQVIRLLRHLLRRSMEKVHVDKGVIQFLDSLAKTGLLVLLVLMVAASMGVDAASIVAILGSAGVAVGLAIQGSLSNVAGGMLILLFRPFALGDYIRDKDGNEGTVREIRMIYTKLQTSDNKVIVLPNGALANNYIINFTGADLRRLDLVLPVGIEGDSREGIPRAKALLLELLEQSRGVRKDREILVFVDSWDGSCLYLGLRAWYSHEDFWPARWDLWEQSKIALEQAGFAPPAAHMRIWQEADKKEVAGDAALGKDTE